MPAFAGTLISQANPFTRIEQAIDNSPYSRFGLGDIASPYYSHLYHMGQLGAAYNSSFHLNVVNPASYASLNATSFETGLFAENSELTESDNSFTSWTGNLSYMALGFPLTNPINDLLDRKEKDYKIGMAFSIQPFTTVGYKIQTVEEVEGVGGITRDYVGNGGTYSFQWGNGIKYKDFSFGFNVGYLFGSIGTDRTTRFDTLVYSFHNLEFTNSHVTGFLWNAGAQYELTLNKKELEKDRGVEKKRITFGIYGNSPTNFKTSNDEVFLIVRDAYVSNFISDTITDVLESQGAGKLPAKLGIGAMYNFGEKFGFGINYETQNWSIYENDSDPQELTNGFTLSAGGYFRPEPQSFTNFLKRIHYQLGGFYTRNPVSVQNEEVNTYGVTVGAGLPFSNQRRVSNANLGVTFGERGAGTAIQERFIRINFGFTFNSTEWFIKRKYN